jgi:hypothetical protein
MSKLWFPILFLMASLSLAVAEESSDTFSGYATLSGKVRDANGNVRHFNGVRIPVVGERVEVRRVATRKELFQPAEGHGRVSTVYEALAGSGYASLADPDPHTADDHVIAGGVNQPWTTYQFGMVIDINRPFTARWVGYDNIVTGQGPNVSAFEGELFDLRATVSEPPGTGGWLFTFNLAALDIRVPNDSFAMTQEFRMPSATGLGAFDPAMGSIYNAAAPPSVGSSANGFFMDENLDGIIDENEFFVLQNSPASNLARKINAGGTLTSVSPVSVNILQGLHAAGTLSNLTTSNDQYYQLRTAVQLQPIIVQFEATAPPGGSFLGMLLTIEASSTLQGTMKLELFNFATNQWIDAGTVDLSHEDQSWFVRTTTTTEEFVNPANGAMRLQITGTPPPARSVRTWILRFDEISWSVHRQ